jgi:hypothetical protein
LRRTSWKLISARALFLVYDSLSVNILKIKHQKKMVNLKTSFLVIGLTLVTSLSTSANQTNEVKCEKTTIIDEPVIKDRSGYWALP